MALEYILIIVFLKVILINNFVKNYKVKTVLDYYYNHYLFLRLFPKQKMLLIILLFLYKIVLITAVVFLTNNPNLNLLILMVFVFYMYKDVKNYFVFENIISETNEQLLNKMEFSGVFSNKYFNLENIEKEDIEDSFLKTIEQYLFNDNFFLVWKKEIMTIILFIALVNI